MVVVVAVTVAVRDAWPTFRIEAGSQARALTHPSASAWGFGACQHAGVEAEDSGRDTNPQGQIKSTPVHLGVIVVAKYLLLFSLTGEATKRFIVKPSDRAAVVRELVESVGGGLESYYWMFGQYDGAAIVSVPDSHTAAALSLAVTSSGAFRGLETHELIEASDLTAIAERARGITYQAPGT